MKKCEYCGGDMPEGMKSNAKYCGRKCTNARARMVFKERHKDDKPKPPPPLNVKLHCEGCCHIRSKDSIGCGVFNSKAKAHMVTGQCSGHATPAQWESTKLELRAYGTTH